MSASAVLPLPSDLGTIHSQSPCFTPKGSTIYICGYLSDNFSIGGKNKIIIIIKLLIIILQPDVRVLLSEQGALISSALSKFN